MKINSTIFLLFALFCQQMLFSQEQDQNDDQDQPCSCLLLKENEANDLKVIELAEYVENGFHDLSAAAFDEKFDIPSFLNTVASHEDIEKTTTFTKSYLKGIASTGNKLSEKLVTMIEEGSYYNLINYRYDIIQRAYYFTFRLYSEEAGVNYHDYKVCSDGTTLKFNDIYVYLTGEPLSSTMQRMLVLSQPSTDKSARENMDSYKNVFLFLNSRKLAEKGDYKRAYDKISAITPPMSTEKFTLLMKAQYASLYDDELYEVLLTEYAELFPKDPTLYLKLIDYNLLKGNFKAARENVDKLIYETDDDFLYLIKGNIYAMENDFSNAETHYKYMTDNYPDLLEGYIGYMISLNYQDRFEEMITVIEDLITQEYDKVALLEFIEEEAPDGSNALGAFVASETYKTWKQKS